MGKKPNTKAKEKKQERKAMVAKSNAIWASVKKANEQEDPLAALPSFQAWHYNRKYSKIPVLSRYLNLSYGENVEKSM